MGLFGLQRKSSLASARSAYCQERKTVTADVHLFNNGSGQKGLICIFAKGWCGHKAGVALFKAAFGKEPDQL